MTIVNCVYCGDDFRCINPHARCCSNPECRRQESRRRNALVSEEYKKLKITNKLREAPKQSLVEVAILAKKAGLSYGEYVSTHKL